MMRFLLEREKGEERGEGNKGIITMDLKNHIIFGGTLFVEAATILN
jgi:hypothetical protein